MIQKETLKKELIDSICDDLIDRVLRSYREYYIVISWEICLVPKRSK